MEGLLIVLLVVAALLLSGAVLLAPRLRRPPRRPTQARGPAVAERPPQAPPVETPVAEAPQVTAPPEAPPAAPTVEAPPAEAPQVETPTVEAPVEEAPVLERPEPTAGRLVRLRARLSRSQNVFGQGLLDLLARDKLDDDTWDEVEETLIAADVGVEADPRDRGAAARADPGARHRSAGELRGLLAEELVTALDPALDRSLKATPADGKPAVLLVVGRQRRRARPPPAARSPGCWSPTATRCVLGAADTFRAAAADQLATWAGRVGAEVVRGPEGARPGRGRLRRGQAGHRGRRRHGADRHRRPAAEQGRPDGRAGQGQAGGREARPGRRDAAGARRHHRPERPGAGPGVHRGGQRHRRGAHQAGRHRQGRYRDRGAAQARASRSSWSVWAKGRTIWPRSTPSSSSTRCSARSRTPVTRDEPTAVHVADGDVPRMTGERYRDAAGDPAAAAGTPARWCGWATRSGATPARGRRPCTRCCGTWRRSASPARPARARHRRARPRGAVLPGGRVRGVPAGPALGDRRGAGHGRHDAAHVPRRAVRLPAAAGRGVALVRPAAAGHRGDLPPRRRAAQRDLAAGRHPGPDRLRPRLARRRGSTTSPTPPGPGCRCSPTGTRSRWAGTARTGRAGCGCSPTRTGSSRATGTASSRTIRRRIVDHVEGIRRMAAAGDPAFVRIVHKGHLRRPMRDLRLIDYERAHSGVRASLTAPRQRFSSPA